MLTIADRKVALTNEMGGFYVVARVRALEKDCVIGEALPIYDEIEKVFGRVPNIFKTYAHFPPLLKANWEKTKAVMMGGSLRRELKEAIALLVSDANTCRYCVSAHRAALQSLGIARQTIDALMNGFGGPDFSMKELSLLQFTVQSTRDPNGITDDDIEMLRKLGWSEREIVEAQGVMELFTGFNKFLDSLGVDIDF